jgi:ketosteroid isomerase-like protein
MKKSILVILISVLGLNVNAQKNEMKAIRKTITAFAKAADNSDAKELANYLDDNYRIVMNRLFGSEKVSIMPRSIYLEKIRTKEFGGDKRTLEFKEVIVNGTTATAQVSFKGAKMTFVSLLMLIKNEQGDWKLVSDTPIVQ